LADHTAQAFWTELVMAATDGLVSVSEIWFGR